MHKRVDAFRAHDRREMLQLMGYCVGLKREHDCTLHNTTTLVNEHD